MKVIDLLNKIANGEEVPKKIRFDNMLWYKINGEKYTYYVNENDNDLFVYIFRKNLTFNLNDEVEIIEEDKKIKKLDLDKEESLKAVIKTAQDYVLADKINEIIDYLEENK